MHDDEALAKFDAAENIKWLAAMVEHGADEHTIDHCERHLYEAVTGIQAQHQRIREHNYEPDTTKSLRG